MLESPKNLRGERGEKRGLIEIAGGLALEIGWIGKGTVE